MMPPSVSTNTAEVPAVTWPRTRVRKSSVSPTSVSTARALDLPREGEQQDRCPNSSPQKAPESAVVPAAVPTW